MNDLLTNAKRNTPGIIRLDLQFHIANYYKKKKRTNHKLLTNLQRHIKLKRHLFTKQRL